MQKPFTFSLADIQKPQTEVTVKVTGQGATPADQAPQSFSLADIVPKKTADVGGQSVSFPGTMSEGDIQSASQDVYGKPATQTGGGLMRTLETFWKEVNPLTLMQGIGQAVTHPIETGKNVLGAQGALLDKAKASADSGDYVTATRHFLSYLLPLVGPGIDAAADMAAEGDIAGSLGKSAGIGVMNLGPVGISQAQSIRVPLAPKNPNPVVSEAVAFAQREGIPVPPATATGNPVIQGIQKLADNTSLAGSYIAQKAAGAHDDAIASVGQTQAARAYPSAVTPEQAGAGVRDAVRGARDVFAGQADAAYTELRRIEQSATPTTVPTTVQGRVSGGGTINVPQTADVRMAVDIGRQRPALTPLYQQLTREKELTGVMQGAKARALVALDNLMHGDAFAPLSVVDAALSDLKAFARTKDNALRSSGQGAMEFIVRKLDAEVLAAARREGPQAVAALNEGRKATIAKYAADEIFETIKAEPVGAYKQATAYGDSAITQLREVAKLAPAELPKIARAYLDELLSSATAEGGFNKARTLHTAWERLGPETKKLLFSDPAYIKDLDNFFLYAKKAAENPNPSGTAYVGGLLGHIYMFKEPLSGAVYEIAGAGLSKLLHSPKTTRVLLNGLRMPMGNKTGATAAAANLMKVAGEAHVPMGLVADRAPGTPQRPEGQVP